MRDPISILKCHSVLITSYYVTGIKIHLFLCHCFQGGLQRTQLYCN